ncbi:alpha/beta hydrolase [Nocardioides coralli]|uniref:alpha/beta hydrolase n=1 Tax=Nocardioides coralli TaxID=2872154 RepID=UPI001CA40A79|nr:alpha/beta hydrolase-fold protein [Nocardioides coralli]QZY28948.1 esterase [Nocardioides coralli]
MTGFVTAVEGDAAVVRLPGHADAEQVRLWCDLELGNTTLDRLDAGWEVRLTDLPVDRLEYLLDVDGAMQTDPTHDRTVGGPFGDHSWLPLPAYAEPGWLAADRVAAEQAGVVFEDTPVGDVEVTVWAPADADGDEPLPMLLCHDGPEMAAYGGLLDWASSGIAADRLPRMRVGLLAPGSRNERYAANPAYAAALVDHVVPGLRAACPTDHRPVLAGQSLGAVAALHAAWTSPGTFAGLLLQSGSFFTPELDPQESDFEYWDEVTGFVASLLAATTAAPSAPVVAMTCGSAEENHANNLQLRDHLAATGMTVTWGEVRQGHTWTCWRDSLDPSLTDLLRKVWG